MHKSDLLKLTPDQLNGMSTFELQQVAYIARSLRGVIYDLRTNKDMTRVERYYGMSIQKMKDHTLALLDRVEELTIQAEK